MKKLWIPIALVIALLLVFATVLALSGQQAASVAYSISGEPPAGQPLDRGVAGPAEVDLALAQVDRMIIRSGSLSLTVEDVPAKLSALNILVAELGGWVVSSETTTVRADDDAIRAVITIRIPAERFDNALQRIKADTIGVTNEYISGQDVTDEYADLRSSLRNLESAETQLRQIMENATKTEDVLHVFTELTRIRGEIEVLKGRMQYLEQSASFASISVSIYPKEAPPTPESWQPGQVAEQALTALVNTVQVIFSAGIWSLIYFGPFAIVLSVPAFFIYRRNRRRSGA